MDTKRESKRNPFLKDRRLSSKIPKQLELGLDPRGPYLGGKGGSGEGDRNGSRRGGKIKLKIHRPHTIRTPA